MKNNKIIGISLALALTVGSISMVTAQTRPEQNSTNFTNQQQQTINNLEAKYQQELTAKENDLRAKSAELDRALANGDTTLATVNNLRNELASLEQGYWQLRNQINREISTNIGVNYYGQMTWGPYNCRWHNSHNYRPMARGYGHGPMMARGTAGNNGWYCRW